MDNNPRNKNEIPFNEEAWNLIDMAVYEECKRIEVAAKFLPPQGVSSPNQTTVPSDTVIFGNQRGKRDDQKLSIDETATTPFVTIEVGFKLTPPQLLEENLSSFLTLATRAANLAKQAEDCLIFNGDSAISGPNAHPLFTEGKVKVVAGSAGLGLLNAPNAPGANPELQIIEVPVINPGETPPKWGEETYNAVAEAYSRLQSGEGLPTHYGPYVCVLNYLPFADSYKALTNILDTPASRIKPLVTEMPYGKGMYMEDEGMHKNSWDMSYGHYPNYFGTGTVPRFRGFFQSLGGNTVDLVTAQPLITEYVRQEGNNYCFRVYERFALRLKDSSSIIVFNFSDGQIPQPEG